MKRRILSIALLTAVAILLVRPRAGGPIGIARLGRAMRGLRSGDTHSASGDATLHALPRFGLASPAFGDGMPMPVPYVGAGASQPPLTWTGVPAEAVECALIVEDIDVPLPRPLVHAIAYSIAPTAGGLAANVIPRSGERAAADATIRLGRGAGGQHFLPPTPIPGHGAHRYVFQMFALRAPLDFEHPPNKARLVRALRKLAIARASVTGTHATP